MTRELFIKGHLILEAKLKKANFLTIEAKALAGLQIGNILGRLIHEADKDLVTPEAIENKALNVANLLLHTSVLAIQYNIKADSLAYGAVSKLLEIHPIVLCGSLQGRILQDTLGMDNMEELRALNQLAFSLADTFELDLTKAWEKLNDIKSE